MKRKAGIYFIVGLISGIIFILVILGIWNQREKNASYETVDHTQIRKETVEAESESQDKDNKEERFHTEQATNTYLEWDKQAVYNGGEFVIYKDKIYKAKWWTQGETPDAADVWEDTLQTPRDAENVKEAETEAIGSKDAGVNSSNAQKSKGFKAVGYFPSWKAEELDKIRYDVLTHVIYAFAIPTSEGELLPLENGETAKKIISEAHKNGVKVSIAIGGWSYNDIPLEPTFVSATENSLKIKKFADEILQLCGTYGFDGVDMDWEHPRADGASAKQYEELMLYLAEELHKENKVLSSAVLSGATADGNIYYDAAAHSDAVLKAVDWINVMAYDGGDGERHSTYQFALDCGAYWQKTRKMPKEKVVLGLPFYARPSWASYETILEADRDADQKDTSLVYGMEAYYNGVDTIKRKTRYAKENLGGIMIWEITQDTTDREKSLSSAIKDIIK